MMVGGFAAAGRQHSFGSSRTRQTALSGNQRDSSRFSMLFGASQGSMDRAVADIHSQHFKGVKIDWTARLPPESLFDKDVVCRCVISRQSCSCALSTTFCRKRATARSALMLEPRATRRPMTKVSLEMQGDLSEA